MGMRSAGVIAETFNNRRRDLPTRLDWKTQMENLNVEFIENFAADGKWIALVLLRATDQTDHTIKFTPSIRFDGESCRKSVHRRIAD
jgi:hypothetical protein